MQQNTHRLRGKRWLVQEVRRGEGPKTMVGVSYHNTDPILADQPQPRASPVHTFMPMWNR